MIDRLEDEVSVLLRHLHVLEMVIDNEPIGIMKMSNESGYEHHEVRYSLHVLEEESLIEPTNHGAVPTDRTSGFVDQLDEKIDTVIEKVDGMKIESETEIETVH